MYAIFSVAQGNRELDLYNHNAAKKLMDTWGTEYQEVIGFYEGAYEQSFITPDTEVARLLARANNQATILEQGYKGFWYLLDATSGKVVDYYRTLALVSEDEAVRAGNYTLMSGDYYVGTK